MWTTWALPIAAGICLAAACGFRTFVPLLCVAIASRTGLFALDAQYAWLSGTAGLMALGTAAVAEVAGYYVPVLDHALDVIATPLSVVAGAFAMFTSIGSDHGMLGWLLAVLVGGGMSGAVQLTTVKARALSFGTTAGLANPLVATAELVGSVGLSMLAILVPVIAAIISLAVLLILALAVRRLRRARVVAPTL